MSFNALLADLDATAFAELADDVAAVWTKAGGGTVTVAVMIEPLDRPASVTSMPKTERASIARLSAAEVSAKGDGDTPDEGDTLAVNGKVYVIHGEPWLDGEMGRRDWLCRISD